jgi:cytochrome c oxidase assembly protein subunit 15
MMSGQKKYSKSVRVWLFIGLVMLVVQVMVGGITRLTGSGLSITEWDIIQGTLPPLSEAVWVSEFDLYKDSPQYKEINQGMEMGSILLPGTFKFIYFWEWVHRLWARVMGIVFLIPFIYFWSRGMFDGMLKSRLIGVFLLAGLAASFGWIMVASGLVERPWVNAYKLALHLSIAFLTYSWLLWTFFKTQWTGSTQQSYGLHLRFGKLAFWFTALLCVQIFLGGVMSGMKAAVAYPTWPDMNGHALPSVIFKSAEWSWDNFNNYDQNLFMPALIQTIHRLVAYCLIAFGIYLLPKIIRMAKDKLTRQGAIVASSLLAVQVLLGILTVINSKSTIPVGYGVAHQIVALFLLTACLHLNYRFKEPLDVSRGT